MIDRTIVLETPRVRLEPLAPHHFPEIARIGNDPVLWEFTYGANPFTNEDDAKRWFDGATKSADRLSFAIVDKTADAVIGVTCYLDIQPQQRKLEIGATFIAPPLWRTHLNTESKYLLLRYAFEEWQAQRVQFKSEAINLRSRAAIERIGATYEGTLRAFRIRPSTGEIRDTAFYSIIAPEWPAIKSRLEDRIRGNRAAE